MGRSWLEWAAFYTEPEIRRLEGAMFLPFFFLLHFSNSLYEFWEADTQTEKNALLTFESKHVQALEKTLRNQHI